MGEKGETGKLEDKFSLIVVLSNNQNGLYSTTIDTIRLINISFNYTKKFVLIFTFLNFYPFYFYQFYRYD